MRLAILLLSILFAVLYVTGLVLIVQIWRLSSPRPEGFTKPETRARTRLSKAA
jgi:hypothetical protein